MAAHPSATLPWSERSREIWGGGTHLAHPRDPPAPEQAAPPVQPQPPGEEQLSPCKRLVLKLLPQHPAGLGVGGRQTAACQTLQSTTFCCFALLNMHVTQVCSKAAA